MWEYAKFNLIVILLCLVVGVFTANIWALIGAAALFSFMCLILAIWSVMKVFK